MSTDERFGARVKALRLAANMPQWHVAHVLSAMYGLQWDQSTVARTESAGRPIRLIEASALAELFDRPVSDLLDDFRPPSEADAGRDRALLELDLMAKHIEARREQLQGGGDQ